MVRNKTQKNNDTEPKKLHDRKQQPHQVSEPASDGLAETSDQFKDLFTSMMPMIMMVMIIGHSHTHVETYSPK
jgi:hypothetical protein